MRSLHQTQGRDIPVSTTSPVSPPARRRLFSFFGNLPIARKLLAGFLVVVVLMVVVGLLGLTRLQANQTRLEYMDRQVVSAAVSLGHVDADFFNVRLATTALVLATDKQAGIDQITASDTAINASLAAYAKTDMTGRQKQVNGIKTALATYRQIRDTELIPLAKANDAKGFIAVRAAKIIPLTTTIDGDITALQAIEAKSAAATLSDSKAAYSSARIMIIGLLIFSALLAVGLALLIGSAVAKPLRRTVEVLQGLAEGRLNQRLVVGTSDEVGNMATALNTAMERMAEVMRKVSGNSDSLASASEELSASSQQIAAGAEETSVQAGVVAAAAEEVSRNVQTVAAGAEQMGASIREIAQNANDAARVASQAVSVWWMRRT